MAAKTKWWKGAWWLLVHALRQRSVRRLGPTNADKRKADDAVAQANAALALGLEGPELAQALGFEAPEPKAEQSEKSLPFDAYAARWLESEVKLPIERRARGALSQATALLHERHIRLYLAPFFADRDVRSLRVPDVQAFYDRCLETRKPKSQRSVEMALATMRRVPDYA